MPDTTADPSLLTIHEAAALIQTGKLSPLELTRAVLDRIERLEPRLNAYITVLREEALEAARAAEASIRAGDYRGPLHGIPIALKDLVATAGVRTTAGSRILADWLPEEDATVVRRLKGAGAVIIGKLNMHEFAFGVSTLNPHYGPTRNPWNLERIPGGSSGGSGAAVAASLCLGALGSDTGGSIRMPSALCGIVGLKPTYGRVSLHGVVPLSWSQDHVGPMTRCVRDAALMLQLLAGHDLRDPCSADAPVDDYAAALGSGASGLRVGVPRNYFLEQVDGDIRDAFTQALSVFEGLGAEVREVAVPFAERASAVNGVIILCEAAAYHHDDFGQRPQDYGDDVRARLALGAQLPAADYIRAARERQDIMQRCDELLAEIDVLLTPTTPIPAPRIQDMSKGDPTLSLIRCTGPFDATGQPAISVPCGFTSEGLPIGLQIAARRFDERTVLRAAHAFEQATDWHGRMPPLA